MKRFMLRLFGGLLVATGVALVVFAMYRNSHKADVPLVFSSRTMLSGLWSTYKDEYWEASTGRTLDKQRDNITTSEGQSYTMLRAVWQSDQGTFDTSWNWTKQHLQRPDDKLFAWKWGKKADGSYGVLTDQGGQNTAADADADIALALLMAGARWQQEKYLQEAQTIITNIWNQEVITVSGKTFLAADNLEKNSTRDIVINPSYFAPYSFKLFAKADSQHNWQKVADDSYDLLLAMQTQPLDKAKSAGLPPDWVLIDRNTGVFKNPTGETTTNYGYDAMRTPWRLALDYSWTKDNRAKKVLEEMSFLNQQWRTNNRLASVYSHDGQTLTYEESAAVYGGNIGYFVVVQPHTATAIYERKLKSLYDANTQSWNQPMSYYSDNWAWFGMALYNNLLENPVE